MKNLKIGVTIKLESIKDSLWTNGMKLNIFDDSWKTSKDTSVNYIVKLKKN